MSLKIYNTMTRTKEEFVPITPGKATMYVCGPTVYDYIHIGNGRPVIFFDVVRRYLEQIGYDVTYVSNFTDVDDKLIKKAAATGMTVPQVADSFIQAFKEDTAGLLVREADIHPRVTETMEEILAFIKGLEEKGFAYESGGDVYFRTEKFEEYGKLSGQKLEELQHGIRIEVDERKENPTDFVLWKAAKPGEIYWESPWGQGRPGWHIECSAMINKYLGLTIDIHGGGFDLPFPHHECEVAQSEALHDEPLARYWMHNGYLNINNEKMSKSLGNGVNVRALLERAKAQAIRYLMLSTHYRNPLNFSEEALKQAESSVARIDNSISNLKFRLAQLDQAAASQEETVDTEVAARIQEIRSMYHDRMQDDFNTADAITAVFDLVSLTNVYLQDAVNVNAETLRELLKAFEEFDSVLGILITENAQADGLLDAEIDSLIQERQEARKTKNWARADEIRDLLQEQGIVLEDTPQGVRWKRK